MQTKTLRRWSIGFMPDHGDKVGYTSGGRAIRLIGGGARETFENWIPVQHGDKAITEFQQKSAVEAVARHEPMSSEIKDVDRSGGFAVGGVGKGAAYGENAATNDKVRLTAEKIGGAARIAEEDIDDTTTDILATKRVEAAGSMAKFFDHAALGSDGPSNGTTILYNSLWYLLNTTDANAPGGQYTADDNVISTAGDVSYDDFSNALGMVEGADWADDANVVWIAHPSFKAYLRGIKNSQGDPIWREGLAGSSPDTILGKPVYWTRGARRHATNTSTPTGNALAFVGDGKGLIVGDRTGMETAVNDQVGFLTDEVLMKARMRKGFNISHQRAWAVIEKTAS